MSSIRTRFAPSPTGLLHVGGVRTALFAWLVARQRGGQFILRIEDTDKVREVVGSEKHILDCLDMLGLDRDEGIDAGGPYAPYKQSDRLELYKKWGQQLVAKGRAYADPYTSEQVQAFREEAKSAKRAYLYREHRPDSPPEWDGTMPLRFKSDPKAYKWTDAVMGDLSSGSEVIDDFILIKSDGYPTYNFAHIVDDSEMKITHVIRGQEFISSMPNYLNLYEALSLEVPTLATMPHIMNEHGNKKLSKRDGAKDVLDYIREGFLPETLLGFIASLGWNDGTEQEIFSRSELIKKFSLDKVQKSGARFDIQRLLWMNGQWIRKLDTDDLYLRAKDFWPESAQNTDENYKKRVLSLVQDRLKTLADLPIATNYFFTEPESDKSLIENNKQLNKLTAYEQKQLLHAAHDSLHGIAKWNAASIQQSLNDLLVSTGQKPGILFSLIRIVTTWAPFSPQLDETLGLLGKETVLRRLKNAPL